jgi:hypothetical protein
MYRLAEHVFKLPTAIEETVASPLSCYEVPHKLLRSASRLTFMRRIISEAVKSKLLPAINSCI